MSNKTGDIDEIIGEKAFERVRLMVDELGRLRSVYTDTVKDITAGMKSMDKAASVKEVTTNVDNLATKTKKLNEVQTQFVETQSKVEKAFRTTGTAVTELDKQMVKAIEEANKWATEEKKTQASLGNTKKSIDQVKMAWKDLETMYKNNLKAARDIGVQYGVNSKQFKDVALATNSLRKEMDAINTTLGQHQANVGNYSSALKGVWSGLRQIAYVIPGLGIAGIFDLAITGATELAKGMGILSDETKKAADALQTMEDALSQFDKRTTEVNTWIDRESKLLLAQAKARGASLQEISKIEQDAMDRKIKSIDTETERVAISIKEYERLIALKQAGAVNMQDEKVYQDALNKAIEKHNGLLEKRADIVADKQINSLNLITTLGKQKAKKDKRNQLAASKENIIDDIRKVFDMEDQLLKIKYDKELITENDYYHARMVLAQKFFAWRSGLDEKEVQSQAQFNQKLADIEKESIDKQQKMLSIDTEWQWKERKTLNERLVEEGQDLLERSKKFIDDYDSYAKHKSKERKENQKELFNSWTDLMNNAYQLQSELISISEQQINTRLEKELAAIDKRYKAEEDAIDRLSISDKEKEERKKKLELEANARKDRTHREEVTRLRRLAIFQKNMDIGQIVANTAIAITSHMKLTPPANYIAMAADAVAGAAQVAAVLARPLPQYAKGRKGGKAEFAVVNEQGAEVVQTKDGNAYIPNEGKKGVTFLPEGASVIPHHEAIKNAAFVKLQGNKVDSNNYANALIAAYLEGTDRIEEAILKSKSNWNIYADTGVAIRYKSKIR